MPSRPANIAGSKDALATANQNFREINVRIDNLQKQITALQQPATYPLHTYVPTITAGAGTFTTVSATGRYRQIGKLIFIQITVTITTNGTAASYVLATLPFSAANTGDYILSGRANQVSGKMLQGNVGANTNAVAIVNYDNTYPGASGEILMISGFYEVA